MISDVWISRIISDGCVNKIAGMVIVVVCSSVGVEASAYFLPQPVDFLVGRCPVQTNVLPAQDGLSVVWRSGTGLRGAGS